MKTDKIYGNSYHSSENDGTNVIYKASPQWVGSPSDSLESDIEYKRMSEAVESLISTSEISSFNELNEKGEYKKLKKEEINTVYTFVIDKLDFPKFYIFSILSDYFDIHANKFYTSLSNKLKLDLKDEMDSRGLVPAKYKRTLF